MPSGAPPIALFRVLAHNPRVLSRFRAGSLLDPGELPIRERELLILRVCRLCDCEYEWSVHATVFAEMAGLSEADLCATLQMVLPESLSRRERAMFAAVDELIGSQRVTAAAAADLRLELAPAEIVELIALVGRYAYVAMLANSAELPLEPGVQRWPQGPKSGMTAKRRPLR